MSRRPYAKPEVGVGEGFLEEGTFELINPKDQSRSHWLGGAWEAQQTWRWGTGARGSISSVTSTLTLGDGAWGAEGSVSSVTSTPILGDGAWRAEGSISSVTSTPTLGCSPPSVSQLGSGARAPMITVRGLLVQGNEGGWARAAILPSFLQEILGKGMPQHSQDSLAGYPLVTVRVRGSGEGNAGGTKSKGV